MLPDMSRLKLGPRSRPTGAGADEAAASVGDKRAAPAGSGGEDAAAEAPPPPEAVRRLLREAERVVQELREARVYSPFWQAEADALLEEAERLLLEQAGPPEAARALSDAVAALHAALLRMAALPQPPSMRQLGRAFDAAMDELRQNPELARALLDAAQATPRTTESLTRDLVASFLTPSAEVVKEKQAVAEQELRYVDAAHKAIDDTVEGVVQRRREGRADVVDAARQKVHARAVDARQGLAHGRRSRAASRRSSTLLAGGLLSSANLNG